MRERELRRAGTKSVVAPASVTFLIPDAADVAPEACIHAQAPMHELGFDRVKRSSIGSGHTLFVSGDIVFCWTCGFWTSGRVRRDGLGGACRELKKSNESKLRRLRRAEHPHTQETIPQPRRLR